MVTPPAPNPGPAAIEAAEPVAAVMVSTRSEPALRIRMDPRDRWSTGEMR